MARTRLAGVAASVAVSGLLVVGMPTAAGAATSGHLASWVPNDPGHRPESTALTLAGVPRAWDVARGEGVTIAVVSDGVWADTPDLAGALLPGLDLVSQGHWGWGTGTRMALIAAARADNGIGLAGVAPRATILPVRAADRPDVAEGIEWAADHGADVVLISQAQVLDSAAELAAVRHASAAGAVVIASAGDQYGQAPRYPAAHARDVPGMLSVTALGRFGSVPKYGAFGDWVSVSAPGEWVDGTDAGPTSAVAAAVVAGVAALVRGAHPDWSPEQVVDRIGATVRDAGPRGVDPYFGRGVVDAAAALGLGAALPWAPESAWETPDDGTDDVPAGATRLETRWDGSFSGTGVLAELGDTDWFVLPDAAAGPYTVSVLDAGPDAWGEVVPVLAVDADGVPLEQTSESTIEGTLRVTRPGPVFLRVDATEPSARRGAYRVRLVHTEPTLRNPPAPWALHRDFVWDVTPANYAVGVATISGIGIGLWREPAPGSVTAESVRLVDGTTGDDVPATRTVDDSGWVDVVPDGDLVPGRHYELVVAGLVDVDGVTQHDPFRSWFTVEAGGDRFTPVTPHRVLDTREGPSAAPVAPGRPVTLDVRVPPSASAVVLNVTAASPSGTGNVRVYPTPDQPGTAPPTVSNLNVIRGVDQPNLVTVPVGGDGTVTLATDGMSTHLVADLAGWYSAEGAAGYVPLEPVRVMDTRDGSGSVPREPVRAGRWVELQVTGRHAVPEDALAVVLNVTGTSPGGPTNVRVYPTPEADREDAVPTVSNLNLQPGRDQPNAVTVRVGEGGKIRFYSQTADVHLLADLAGYYSATGHHGFVPVEPTRIADTRYGLGLGGPLRPGVTSTLGVGGRAGVPLTAGAAVLTVTAVGPDAVTNVRAFPAAPGGVVPLVSTLNVVPRRDEPNHAIARLGHDGGVSFFSQTASLGLVVDVAGYFTR